MPEKKTQGQDLSDVTGGTTRQVYEDIMKANNEAARQSRMREEAAKRAEAADELVAAEADFANLSPEEVARDQALYSKAVRELALGQTQQADADIKALRAEGDASTQ